MPPSTPGRLPPLPVVETVSNTSPAIPISVAETVVPQSPIKSAAAIVLNEVELQISESSPVKKAVENANAAEAAIVEQFFQKKVPVPISPSDKKSASTVHTIVAKSPIVEQKVSFKRPGEISDTSQKNIDLLEDLYESLEQIKGKEETMEIDTDNQGN